MWWNANILLKAWFLAYFIRCKWTSWTDQDWNTSNFWGQKWFYRFTSTLNVEIFLPFQIRIFKKVETHAFQVEGFCHWDNFFHLVGKQKKPRRSAESQNEQQELKNLISHEFIYSLLHFICWAKEVCDHIIGKNIWYSIRYGLGDKSLAQLTEVKCNKRSTPLMYMAAISDVCMTSWTIAKTHILNDDCSQGLKHAIKLQKYLVKMIKYTFIYLYIFIQPIRLLRIYLANKISPEQDTQWDRDNQKI